MTEIVSSEVEDKRIISATWAKDEDIGRFLRLIEIQLGKKINYLFLKDHQRYFQPPTSKIFIAFPIFALKTSTHHQLSV